MRPIFSTSSSRGYLDSIPVEQVARWEEGFLQFIREQKHEIWSKLDETGELDDETDKAIESAIGDFQKQFDGSK